MRQAAAEQCGSFRGLRFLQRGRRRAVNLFRLRLAYQAAVGGELRIEFQRAEKRVIAEIEADEGAELDDLVVAVMLAQLVEKSGLTDISSL